MAKRTAERDINDRNWDQEEEPEEAGIFSQASSDAMKSRQVIRAKRRNMAAEGGSTSFTGLSSFSFKPTQTSTPFNFNVKSVTNGKTSEDQKKTATDMSFQSLTGNKTQQVKTAESDKKQTGEDDKKMEQYLADLKNLNESVLSWIKQHVEKNAYCILTPIFSDYDKHLKEIEKQRPEGVKKDELNVNGVSAAPTSSNNDLKSTIKPSEAPKPEVKTDTSMKNDNLLAKFKPPAGNWTCDTCLISNKEDANKCIACETPKPGAKNDSKSSGSSFTPSTGFSFTSSSTQPVSQTTTGFTFGTSKLQSDNKSISFGIGKTQSDNQGSAFNTGKPLSDKGFSFGGTKTQSDGSGFSFGAQKTDSNNKGFSFGSNGSSEQKSSSTGDEQAEEKKGFQFGTGKSTADGKGFSFGTQNASDGKGFSFGTQKPAVVDKAFSFGTDKPAPAQSGFSFGLPKPTQDTAGFTFGQQKSEPAGFSFGPTKVADTAGFSFAFGKGATGDSKPAETEEEEYEPPKPESTEIKEEGSLYSIKCKLFYQASGEWKEKGVGFLHLKMADTKLQLVVRTDTALGNILLNIILSESIPLSRQGKNNISMFCVPNPPLNPKDDSKKPVPMLIRVKTGEEADKLLEKMKELRDK